MDIQDKAKEDGFLKFAIVVIIFTWLISTTFFVFVPAYKLITSNVNISSNDQVFLEAKKTLSEIPLPAIPKIDKNDSSNKNLIEIYKQEVIMYNKKVDFLEKVTVERNKFYLESSKVNNLEVYKVVVKDTMISLVSSILTALVAFAFVNTTSQVIDNNFRIKNNKEVERIKPFRF